MDKTENVNGICPINVITNMALIFTNLGIIDWGLDEFEKSKRDFELSIDSYIVANGLNHVGLAD